MTGAIKVHGTCLGRAMMIERNHAFGDSDREVFEFFVRLLAQELQKGGFLSLGGPQQGPYFLSRLLDGEIPNPITCTRKIFSIAIPLRRRYTRPPIFHASGSCPATKSPSCFRPPRSSGPQVRLEPRARQRREKPSARKARRPNARKLGALAGFRFPPLTPPGTGTSPKSRGRPKGRAETERGRHGKPSRHHRRREEDRPEPPLEWGPRHRRAAASSLRAQGLLASIYFSPVSLNRRAVCAKAVPPVALTYFHRFRSRLDGAVPRQVLQPVGPAGGLATFIWTVLRGAFPPS